MNKLNTEGIVNELFSVSKLDFDTEYSRFFKEGTEAIKQLYEQFKHRVLSEFKGLLDNSFWIDEMYLESIPKNVRKELSFEQQKEYCRGYNDCVIEHNERVKKIKEIVLFDLNKLF